MTGFTNREDNSVMTVATMPPIIGPVVGSTPMSVIPVIVTIV